MFCFTYLIHVFTLNSDLLQSTSLWQMKLRTREINNLQMITVGLEHISLQAPPVLYSKAVGVTMALSGKPTEVFWHFKYK